MNDSPRVSFRAAPSFRAKRGISFACSSLFLLAACPGPGTGDAGTTAGGTGGSALVGPCAPDGGCPADAYCLLDLHQCSANAGLSIQVGLGNCYLINPCANGGTCEDEGCATDTDCGESLECDSTGLCCSTSDGSCTSVGGGTGGGVTPQCSTSTPPTSCPEGCFLYTPYHSSCTTCLCPGCPDGG